MQKPEVIRRRGGNMKLDREKVATIKLQIASGESLTRLARAYGVEYQTLYRLARGETWKEVEPTGNLIQRQRPKRAITPEERDKLYKTKLKKGFSNKKLARLSGHSESAVARAIRDAELVRAFRVQRFLLTSGDHSLAMEEFKIDRKEADRLTSVATGSRIPKHLRVELE